MPSWFLDWHPPLMIRRINKAQRKSFSGKRNLLNRTVQHITSPVTDLLIFHIYSRIRITFWHLFLSIEPREHIFFLSRFQRELTYTITWRTTYTINLYNSQVALKDTMWKNYRLIFLLQIITVLTCKHVHFPLVHTKLTNIRLLVQFKNEIF